MRELLLFAEDYAHETIIGAILQKLAAEQHVETRVDVRTSTGGHGRMGTALKRFVRELRRGRRPLPDLLVIGRDANCQGLAGRQREMEELLKGYPGDAICAIPDPHIERWLLVDSAAFKKVLGKGCAAPDHKCEKDRYKGLLIQAVIDAGLTPLIGGIEHATDLVEAMNFTRAAKLDDSLGRFLKSLQGHFKRW